MKEQLRRIAKVIRNNWSDEMGDAAHLLASDLNSIAEKTGWRPIETAPSPNPRCLVYCPDQSPEMQVLIVPAGLLKTKKDATHWMPFPEPPNASHQPPACSEAKGVAESGSAACYC